MSKKTSRKTAVRKDVRQLLKLPEFVVGIALLVLSLLLGWGLSMVIPTTPHNGILITIGGFLISGPFFLRAYQLYAHLKIKKRTWGILIAVIVGLLALIVTQLQFTQARPKLRVDFDSSSTFISTVDSISEIHFRIVNSGQSAAYQYHAIMFVVPENQLQEVIKADPNFSTNSIEPGEPEYCMAAISRTNPVGGVWYIYYKLIYSNSPTGGHLYNNDSPYWLSCDFSNPQKPFVELIPAQRDIFKAAIKVCYPDEDIR